VRWIAQAQRKQDGRQIPDVLPPNSGCRIRRRVFASHIACGIADMLHGDRPERRERKLNKAGFADQAVGCRLNSRQVPHRHKPGIFCPASSHQINAERRKVKGLNRKDRGCKSQVNKNHAPRFARACSRSTAEKENHN